MKNSDFKDSRLLEAFDYIDQKYIAEVADSLKFEKAAPMPAKGFNRRTWRHIAALAACVLLLGAVIPMMTYLLRNFGDIASWFPEDTTEESNPLTEPETPPEETTTLPPETTEEETTAEPETTACTHPNLTVSENMPTCTESATIQSYCSDCGYSESKVLPPLGHDFVNGICTRCGATEENYVSIGLEYKAFGDYAVLVGIGTCTDPDIIIASEFQGLPVTEIWHEAFVGVKGMRSVKIPEGVTYIESHAFENCTDLRAVYLPASLENVVGSLMTHGFVGCPAIETIEIAEGGKKYYSTGNCLIERETGTLVFGCGKSAIPADGSVKAIGEYAFNGCRNLVSLALPEGVTHIRTGAFSGCEALRTLTLPKSLITIRQNAFENCTSLSSLTIPESVTEIYNGAFRGCLKLRSVTLPSTLTFIDSEAFLGTAIESIVIPKNVKELGAVFSECEKLTSVTLPEGFESFVGHTFAGCTSLKSITLPKSLKNIGMNTFYGCTALTDLRFAGTVAQWKLISKQEHWNDRAAFTVIRCSDGDVEAIEYDGSRGLVYRIVGDYAVLDGIGSCTDTDIVVGKYYDGYPVRQIDQWALANTSIKSVKISDTVTRIDHRAFSECKSLESIYISASVNEIDHMAFYECPNITSIVIDPDNKFYEGKNCIIEKKSKWLLLGCRTTVIPSDGSVTCIGYLAFYKISGITSVTIPEGVTDIDTSAFDSCPDLREVHLPSTLVWLTGGEGNAFQNCDNIRIITVAANNPKLYSKNNCVIERETGALIFGCASSVIPNDGSVKIIDHYAFGSTASLTEIVIPEGVTEIRQGAFASCTNLKKISLPKSLTEIDSYAFASCTSLESVTLGENVTYIGTDAFRECASLKYVTFPKKVEYLGESVFSGCASLESIILPEGIERIYGGMFIGCSNLKTVVLPDGLKSIGQSAFLSCTALESIVIPDGVTMIDGAAFFNCSGLKSITIPKSVSVINSETFRDCKELTEIVFLGEVSEWKSIKIGEGWNTDSGIRIIKCSDGDIKLYDEPEYDGSRGLEYEISDDGKYAILVGIGTCTDKDIVVATTYNGLPVTAIGNSAFRENTVIRSVKTSDTVEVISYTAFSGCTSLESIYISSSVREIGMEAFLNTDPASITVDPGNKFFSDNGNCIIDKATKTLIFGCSSTVIPSDGSVEIIGMNAFYGNGKLISITVPEGVTEIYPSAFSCCSNLSSVSLPNSLRSLGMQAFYKCEKLQGIALPKGITEIHDYTFAGCVSLKSVTGTENLTKIYPCAFEGCTSLASFTFESKLTLIDSQAFKNCASLKSIDIPESVTEIGQCTFEGCTALESVTIRGKVDMLYAGVFSHCSSLKSVSVNKARAISDYAFEYCTALEHISLPESLEVLGRGAFNGCTSLKIINLPAGITEIGAYAFSECESLSEIVIPEGVTVIGSEAFYLCKNLQNVALPSTLEWIQDWAFAGCESLERITIPDSVTQISIRAFSDCKDLSSLTLGAGVELIEESAFENCTSLGYVKFPKSLRLLANDAFAGCTSLTSVHYAGTIQEWNSVDSTGRDYGNSHVWYEGVPAASVCCTDGDAIIGG